MVEHPTMDRSQNAAWLDTIIHLFQPDSLALRGHLVMFQSTTLQGQAGLSQELDKPFLLAKYHLCLL